MYHTTRSLGTFKINFKQKRELKKNSMKKEIESHGDGRQKSLKYEKKNSLTCYTLDGSTS